jgi:hypothetical protein
MCKATCVCLCPLESTLNVEEKNFPSGGYINRFYTLLRSTDAIIGYLE